MALPSDTVSCNWWQWFYDGVRAYDRRCFAAQCAENTSIL